MHSKSTVLNGPLPLYKQLSEAIRAMVRSGELKPGHKVPSVRELVRRYGVSHITARKCLSDLSSEGVLYARQGLGTFVAERARAASVALLLPGPDDHDVLSDPYYSPILAGILEEAESQGMSLSTIFTGGALNDELCSRLSELNGILLLFTQPSFELGALGQAGRPVVVIDWEDREGSFHSVGVDNQGGGFKAVKYLVGLGHTNVLFITERGGSRNYEERLEGCRTAASSFDLEWREEMVIAEGKTFEGGRRSVLQALEERLRFTAVFALDDCLAAGAVDALKEKGFAVPGEVSVVGFGGFQFHHPPRPALTTISVPKRGMGRAAAARLGELIAGGASGPRTTILPVEVLEGESSARCSKDAG